MFEPIAHLHPGGIGELRWGEFRSLQRQVFGSRWNDRRVLLGFVTLFVSILLVIECLSRWPPRSGQVVWTGLMLLAITAIRLVQIGSDPGALARVLVSRGRCGSCAYPLPEPIADDWYWVCPECGAAWHPDQQSAPATITTP